MLPWPLLLRVVLTSLATNAVVVAVLVVYREAVSKWIGAAIEHSFNTRLENLRSSNAAELEQLRSSLDTERQLVASAFLEARRASNERRLDAIQVMWTAMMRAAVEAQPAVGMTDLATTPEVYKELCKGLLPNIQDLIVTAKQYGEGFEAKLLPVESARLLTGEYLYSIYQAYSAFIGSIALSLSLTKQSGEEFEPWWEDEHVRSIFVAVLEAEELEEFNGLRILRFSWVTRKLETKFVKTAQDIIDGRRAATDASDQATAILGAVKTALVAAKQEQE